MKPLILIATHRLERVELFDRLHAFGHHFESQGMRQRDDGLNDGCIVGARHQVFDEAAINLEIVDGKAA